MIDAAFYGLDFAERSGLIAMIGQDAVQAIMAAAFEPVRDDLYAPDPGDHDDYCDNDHDGDDDRQDHQRGDGDDDRHDPADDYAGLSSTFAAACRKADAKAGARPELPDIPPGCASAVALQREYQDRIRRQREQYGPPKATLDAAENLIREGDAKRLRAWLGQHSAHEVLAITEHIKKYREKRRGQQCLTTA